MSLAIFTGPYPSYDYGVQPSRPAVNVAFGQQTSRRATRSARTYRTFPYVWTGLTDDEASTLDAFFVALGHTVTSFLFRDPQPGNALAWSRFGASLGTAIAAQTAFSLPTGISEHAGDYALSTGLVLKANGAVVTIASSDTDARTVTASSAPGAGVVMTADYNLYRRFVLMAPLQLARVDGLWSTAGSFQEVPA